MNKITDESLIEAVEEADRSSDLIELSTGVVLKGKKANPLALLKVMARFERPKPPMVFMKAMGREMENPEDPDYIERIKAWQRESNMALLNALILLGTELHSTPAGFPRPEDDSWLDEYSVFGLDMRPTIPAWRYLTWITFKACVDEKDMLRIQETVGKLSGVREADVKSAVTFPGSDATKR